VASARAGLIALVAGFLALPGNAVGAESDTDAYCGLAGEFHDHIRSTFDLQRTATDGDTTSAQPGETVELADATEREYTLAMVDVAPLEARAALLMLAEDKSRARVTSCLKRSTQALRQNAAWRCSRSNCPTVTFWMLYPVNWIPNSGGRWTR
jgi:hypothetical protein